MSKADRAKKRQQRKRYAKPSMPRVIGANDNIEAANDNTAPVSIRGVRLSDSQALRFMAAEAKVASPDLDQQRDGQRMFRALDAEIDATILERLGRAVWALREVAGKGGSVLSLTSSGSMRTLIAEALIVALDCAAIAYGLA